MDFWPIFNNWQFLLSGFLATIGLSSLAIVSSIILGGALGIFRCYGPRWATWIVVFYIDSMRALPLLPLLIWVFFVPPLLLGTFVSPFWAALFAITAHVSASIAEIFRAGINSVRIRQSQAAQSLGLSRVQTIVYVVLPQALVRMIPAFGNMATITVKDTALAGVIGVAELMNRAQTLATGSFRPTEVLTFTMFAFFAVMFPITRGTDWLYRKIAFLGRS